MRLVAAMLNLCLTIIPVFAAILFGASRTDALIVAGSLFSPSHGRSFEYRVFTPPGYSPTGTTRYPVVFSLHGNGGTPAQRAATYSSTLTQKMTSGEIMPMIWVFPDGQLDSYYGNAFDGHKQVYTHIIDELLPYIDANFKTKGDRNNRAMEGFSMGGFGSGLYAAKNPELFSATLLYGAVLPNWADLLRKEADTALEMYNNQEPNWLPYSIYDVTAANAAAIAATVDYKQIVGDADGHRQGNFVFRDFLLSLGIDPQFQILPGVTHSGGLYLAEGSGLTFLNDHFLRAGQVSVPCDYNRNGTVDAADYVLWRKYNNSVTTLPNDSTAGTGPTDYPVWRSHFGQPTLGAGSSSLVEAAIPEPATVVLLLFAAAGWYARQRLR
jgi:S-formylglutathione hydrolase FrmB